MVKPILNEDEVSWPDLNSQISENEILLLGQIKYYKSHEMVHPYRPVWKDALTHKFSEVNCEKLVVISILIIVEDTLHYCGTFVISLLFFCTIQRCFIL